jgi:hypothetical protein
MYRIEILLPIGQGSAFKSLIAGISKDLTDRFGGVTAFHRSPAEGLWDDGDDVVRDDIAVLEVMTSEVDKAWWANFRAKLEEDLGQDEIVIRSHPVERL